MNVLKNLFLTISMFMVSSVFSFDAYEHEYLGNSATLHGLDSTVFTLENGIDISFGNLVSMGDFYGMANAPIAADINTFKAITEMDKLESRFLDSFYALSKSNKDELKKILALLEKEKEYVKNAIAKGGSEEKAYADISSKENVEFEMVTHGRYASISSLNFDHFADPYLHVATNAFLGGYNAALKIAKDANPKDIEKLKQAYSILGFASHYLTDTFCSGHMRVPRFEIAESIKGPFHEEISGILALYQHQEEGYYGLNVSNILGKWKALGDSRLFEGEKDEIEMPIKAIQKAIDDIYSAFIKQPKDTSYDILDLIPKPTSNNLALLIISAI